MGRFKKDVFFVIDKPTNINSHEVSSYIKKMLNAEKAGHSGTLDPTVSGVLIVGVNRATKLLRFITQQDKTYIGIVRFKEEKSYKEVSSLFKKFTGRIRQIPPKESAVAKKPRYREVKDLRVLEIKGKRVLFEASVESGTYIRTLCKDMGGVMEELRRTRVGNFYEREAYTMDEIYNFSYLMNRGYGTFIESAYLSPEEVFLRLDMPKINVAKQTAKNLIRGAPLYSSGIVEYEKFEKGEYVSIFSDERFIGVGRALKSELEGVVIKSERIHIREI